jgi:S-DNA-T family DNA segregation ATPase FtsK/SpoIIIE
MTDSRTILDFGGAEKLLGRGDMLYTCAELSKPKRLQGAFLADAEIQRVVNFLKQSGERPDYDTAVVEKQTKLNGAGEIDFSDPDQGDELFDEAKEIILQAGKASTSYLQRRLKIGYARAARLMDLLEEAGIVGPGEGAKPREILITEREVDEPAFDSDEDNEAEVEESSFAKASEDKEEIDSEEDAEEIEKNNE